jgi:endonuclease/exonuclease/phosphatase family metal-dependent hydrolase
MDYWRRSRVSREAAWRWLREIVRPDIALLQETIPPNGVGQVIWKGDGIGKTRQRSSAIVSFGPPIREVRKWKGNADRSENDLQRTFPGTAITALVELPHHGPIAVASLYGLIDDGYAYTTIHRHLTDLNPLLDSRQGKLLIVGGDLNCSTQLDPPYRTIHRNLFNRFEVHGLVNLTHATRDQRPRLEGCPCEEREGCGHVQTHRHSRSRKPWQDDYVFASKELALRLISCEVIDQGSPSPWEFSDHCPVVATFDL